MIAAPRIGNAVKRWGQDNVTEIARWSGHPTEDGSARGDNALLQNIRAAYSVARGKTSDQIYQAFTGGQIPSNPPATPPDSPPGSGGGWLPDPASIGSGFIGGVFHGINTAWQTMIANIIHQGVNAELTTKAPVIFGIGGFFLLVMGLYAAVSRSETVQNTVSLASGVATMGAAGAVKGAASTVTSAARSAPMRTVPSKAVNVGAMRSLPKR